MAKKQAAKRDTLVSMYSYAKEYIDARILDTKNNPELNADYKREALEMQSLFEELFTKIHKGELE